MDNVLTAAIAIAGITAILMVTANFMVQNTNEVLLPYADLEIIDQTIVNFPGSETTVMLQMKIVNIGDFKHEGYTITCYDSNSVQIITNIIQDVEPTKNYDIHKLITGTFNYNDKQFCEVGVTINGTANFVRSGFFAFIQ